MWLQAPLFFGGAFLLVEEVTSKKRSVARAIAAALLAALAAVKLAVAQETAPPPQPGATSTREVTDEVGRRVAVRVPVRRVVSLAPSLTETIYALGAQDRLVGVTDYCDYPPEAKTKPHVGGTLQPNLEQVVALQPDLVLATRAINRRETVEALERLGIAVYATDPRTVEGMLESTQRLAEVIGAQEQGEALVAALRARLERLKQRLAGRPATRVLFVVWLEPLISVGQQTFLADALRWAGAESVIESTQDWPHINLEEVVRLQPDNLVFASSHPDDAERTFNELRTRRGWRNLDAVEKRHVAFISDAVNRPAPRLVDAIEELARQFHPEAFPEKEENRKEKVEKRPGNSALRPTLFSDFYFLFSFSKEQPCNC